MRVTLVKAGAVDLQIFDGFPELLEVNVLLAKLVSDLGPEGRELNRHEAPSDLEGTEEGNRAEDQLRADDSDRGLDQRLGKVTASGRKGWQGHGRKHGYQSIPGDRARLAARSALTVA